MRAGDFLDWDQEGQKFDGPDARAHGQVLPPRPPIRVWIVEQNAAHRYLREFNHFIRWQQMFLERGRDPHQTSRTRTTRSSGSSP